MCRGHFLPLRSISHTHQQVFLYLFVKFIKLLFSLVQGYAGVMVALFPGFKVVRVQVLVGQSQRAEAVAGVLLWGREGWERLAAACRGTDEGLTHVQVRGGRLLQLPTGWVESFKNDGVCSFTVQRQLAFRAADWSHGSKSHDQKHQPFKSAEDQKRASPASSSPMTDILLRTLLKSRMARSS